MAYFRSAKDANAFLNFTRLQECLGSRLVETRPVALTPQDFKTQTSKYVARKSELHSTSFRPVTLADEEFKLMRKPPFFVGANGRRQFMEDMIESTKALEPKRASLLRYSVELFNLPAQVDEAALLDAIKQAGTTAYSCQIMRKKSASAPGGAVDLAGDVIGGNSLMFRWNKLRFLSLGSETEYQDFFDESRDRGGILVSFANPKAVKHVRYPHKHYSLA